MKIDFVEPSFGKIKIKIKMEKTGHGLIRPRIKKKKKLKKEIAGN